MTLQITENRGLQALVYQDQGVSLSSAEALVHQLRKILDPSINVRKVDSAYLSEISWEDKTVVLAMGGGTCTVWEERLGEKGILKIHHYVMGGGKYLGFCAGAYFAASKSYFQVGELPPIVKTRPYFFFNGEAMGPLWADENYLSPEAAMAVKVRFRMGEATLEGKLYYQGGCYFDVPVNLSSVEVVATYEELPKALPAALLCHAGKGLAFLCGPHPEFSWDRGLKIREDLVEELVPQEEFREQLWQQIKVRLALHPFTPPPDSSDNKFQRFLKLFLIASLTLIAAHIVRIFLTRKSH